MNKNELIEKIFSGSPIAKPLFLTTEKTVIIEKLFSLVFKEEIINSHMFAIFFNTFNEYKNIIFVNEQNRFENYYYIVKGIKKIRKRYNKKLLKVINFNNLNGKSDIVERLLILSLINLSNKKNISKFNILTIDNILKKYFNYKKLLFKEKSKDITLDSKNNVCRLIASFYSEEDLI